MEQLLNAGSFEQRNLNFQEASQLGPIFWKNYASHIYSKYEVVLDEILANKPKYASDFSNAETSSLLNDYQYAREIYKSLR